MEWTALWGFDLNGISAWSELTRGVCDRREQAAGDRQRQETCIAAGEYRRFQRVPAYVIFPLKREDSPFRRKTLAQSVQKLPGFAESYAWVGIRDCCTAILPRSRFGVRRAGESRQACS